MIQQTWTSDSKQVQELNAALTASTAEVAGRKIHALSTLWKSLEDYAEQVPRGNLIQKLLGNGAEPVGNETPPGRGMHRPPDSFLVSHVVEPRSAEGAMRVHTQYSGGTRGAILPLDDSVDNLRLDTANGASAVSAGIENAEYFGRRFLPRQRAASLVSSGARKQLYGRPEELTGHRIFVNHSTVDANTRRWLGQNPSEVFMPSGGALSGLTLTALISKNNLWWAGIICAAVAALAGALGDCILRYSFVKGRESQERAPTDTAKHSLPPPLHMRPLWILGMFLSVILNPFLTLVSYRFAAVSVVSMFGGLHTLGSLVFARILLSEKLGWRDVVGGLLIVSGITEVVIFGHNADDSQEFIVNGVAFIIFCCLTFIAIFITAVISHNLSRYPASFIGPVYNGILICLNSVGGIWVFSEYTNSLLLFLLGLASTSAGILISAYSQAMKQETVEPLVQGQEAASLVESDEENSQLAPDEMEY
ncbi:conserved hypothetical protein [Neospora caninum Liverpool]|uniref:Uncharacterized protein n=1 Tax=Neospora caninum (strain Liverpool) TaxID=572307 RepID=F0VC17_NEOCL|nr:conserved hypothetical protein [Neospora caninum Liverpool]CBZ51151.1 conserved hypothetical protein [Neospora caninum Liverpool]CEL68460.1 TPA: hypothetical protein BN1204_042260 [Neospora caninum Liverpool]|eukprot:XP_003881184.1 conserved hypothetical protein [Neospora caninum Liverpool]